MTIIQNLPAPLRALYMVIGAAALAMAALDPGVRGLQAILLGIVGVGVILSGAGGF